MRAILSRSYVKHLEAINASQPTLSMADMQKQITQKQKVA